MSDADVILEDIAEAGRLVSLAEVRDMLEKAATERDELMYEQKIALEHARRFSRVDSKTAAKLIKAIQKQLPDVEEKYAVRVADLLPQHHDDILAIFQKSRHDMTEEEMDKILELVDEHYVA